MKLFNKTTKSISVVAEFDNSNDDVSLNTISVLSDYISDICKSAEVTTDFQKYPAGYRITFKIFYKENLFRKQKKYSKQLARVSKWINKTNKATLHRYQYNINF